MNLAHLDDPNTPGLGRSLRPTARNAEVILLTTKSSKDKAWEVKVTIDRNVCTRFGISFKFDRHLPVMNHFKCILGHGKRMVPK